MSASISATRTQTLSVGDFTPRREYKAVDFDKIRGGGQIFDRDGIKVEVYRHENPRWGYVVNINNSNGKSLYVGASDGNAEIYHGKDVTPDFVGNIIRKNARSENINLENSGAARKFALMFINKKYK